MKVLLINPWIYDFAAYDEWVKPLGLLYIGTFLEKFGYRVSLINCMDRHHPLLKEKFGKRASTNRRYDCGKFFEEVLKKPEPLKNVRFHTPNGLHIRYINQKLAKRLFQANFKTIRLSFETSNPKKQRDSCYKTSNQDLIRAVDSLKTAGYKGQDIEVYIMIGLPGQDFEEIIDTIDFVHTLKVKINPVEFSPVPGTEEYKRAVRDYNFNEDEPLLQNNSIFPMQTKGMNYKKFWKIKNIISELNSNLDT